MKTNTQFLTLILICFCILGSIAQPTPPSGKRWEKIESMSDEFDGTSLNFSKWDDQTYGYYEARMKANKTFLSSTFWLINKRNEFTGCDFRVTELDVTENIGVNTGGQNWINRNIVTLNANTHSRGTACPETPVGSEGNKADIGEPAYTDFHTYGVWWKGPKELLFYLDGQFVFQIEPPSDFDLSMYLRMVVETYDWNPPKDGQDGMNDTFENRTTYYDWVRSYRLVDENGGGGPFNDIVSFKNPETTISSESSYTFELNYEATQEREVVVEFWSATNWIAEQKETVSAGTGVATVTVNLPQAPTPGTGYLYKTHIRPLGTTWREALDNDQINNVTVDAALSVNDVDFNTFTMFPNPTDGIVTIETKTTTDSPQLTIYNFLGTKVYSSLLTNANSRVDVSTLASGIYLVEIATESQKSSKKLIIK